MPTKIFSIGFQERTQENFFEALKKNDIETVCDVRCFPDAENARYARSSILKELLPKFTSASYTHLPVLAPTPDLLDDYFGKRIN